VNGKLNTIRRGDGRVEIDGEAPDEVRVSAELVGDALPRYLRTVLTFSDDFGRVVTYEVTGWNADLAYFSCRLLTDAQVRRDESRDVVVVGDESATINDVRARMGLPPVEWGAHPWRPMSRRSLNDGSPGGPAVKA
jgi:hypothetical protein